MKKSARIMGMPVTVAIVDENKSKTVTDIEKIFAYLRKIDETFSTYKKESEIERINRGELFVQDACEEVQTILLLAEKTRQETQGYFDIRRNGKIDPSGIVKGYAIYEASKKLKKKGYENFFVEIAGDIQTMGKNETGDSWKVGIENPFNRQKIVKIVGLGGQGIAVSGTYIRGQHIYDPVGKREITDVISISVIGPNVYEADRFATAAFAMGQKGIEFIEKQAGLEGYMITKEKKSIYTSGFQQYVL